MVFFQPVGVICDGQTNCAGEADDELSGQRQAGHAERCGPVSQGNSGITALMHQECIGIPRKRAAAEVKSDISILIGAQREAEGVGGQGHAVQSTGWRKGRHQTGASLQKHCGSSGEETAKCSKTQQTAGGGPTPTRSAEARLLH